MAEKVTTMVLNVDLQCCRCYKKIKKVLCKFPEIRDQMYDKQANTVTITVVCCSPEKIRDKICCKGGECIKSIEIKPPPKPKTDVVDKPPKPDPPKEPEKKTEVKNNMTITVVCCCPEKMRDKICCNRTDTPIGHCCTKCCHGHGGGPCCLSEPPPPSRPCYGRCGCGCGGYHYCYASEANPQGCSIM